MQQSTKPEVLEALPLREQVALLAGAREAHSQLDAQYRAAVQLFEQQMAITLASLASTRARRDTLEALVRKGATDAYLANGTRSPAPGVSVYSTEKLEVVDAAELLASCIKQAKKIAGLVEPNLKLVGSLVAAGTRLSGARMVAVPQVRMSSDLHAALAKDEILQAPGRARRAGARARRVAQAPEGSQGLVLAGDLTEQAS